MNTELQKEWKYEFESWNDTFGSPAKALIESDDRSEPYEMDRRHLFELENGQYAVVREYGCSCYDSRDADIELYPTLKRAEDAYKRFGNKEQNA